MKRNWNSKLRFAAFKCPWTSQGILGRDDCFFFFSFLFLKFNNNIFFYLSIYSEKNNNKDLSCSYYYACAYGFSGFDICISFLCLKCPWSVFLGLRRFTIWFVGCFFFTPENKNKKKKTKKIRRTHFYPLLSPPPLPAPPLPPPPSLSLNRGRGAGVVSVPCGPSSLRLHGYASLLLGARVRGDAHGPGGAGLRGGLPLSPESLLRLRRVGYVRRDAPAADLGGRGRGGHAGGHGAATAAAVEALGRLQPGEHGQRVGEVGGRRWCVGWGAHLRRRTEKLLLSGEFLLRQSFWQFLLPKSKKAGDEVSASVC